MSDEPLLEVEGLNVWLPATRRRPRLHIVRDVSFSLAAGRRLALVGESGCGKSTTLLSLVGLLPVGAELCGSIRFAGADVLGGTARGSRELARRRGNDVAVVLQSSMSTLDPVYRVERQMVEAMRPALRADRTAARARVAELLERVGLDASVARRHPHELSGGMRQRVAIATALAAEPRLLLADEPTTALDTVVQARIVELLDELARAEDLAVILVSHHLALAARFCDELAIMYAGRIAERHDAAGALRTAGRHPYTRMLFEATPDLDTPKERVRSIPGAPPSLALDAPACAFAPRCPRALDRCRAERPELAALGAGVVACFDPEDAS